MKRKIVLSVITLVVITIFSCKKKDDMSSPSLTINGANALYVAVGSTYSDPGAIADDGKGNSLNVSTSGNVNTDSIGQYTVNYTTSCGLNGARTVNVVMTQTAALGNYTLDSDCNSGSSLSILGANGNTITVTANGANGITLDHPDASNIAVTQNRDPFIGTFNGYTLTGISGTASISTIVSNSTYTMTGVASFSADGQVLTVDYSWPANGNVSAGNCTATYTKQ